MFAWFERRINPYPDGPPPQPPTGFFRFIWAASAGMRGLIVAMTALTATIGAFEALLFSMLGSIVDWLSQVPPNQLWQQEKGHLLLLAGILLASPLLVWLQSLCKFQGLLGNFPMRLRWNFHRHLLSQSMQFYQDEFAGRVSAKVMQTALAVRDTVMIVADIMVFITIYFITMVAVVGSFDLALVAPFVGWLLAYALALKFFIPRLGRAASAQADARSLMAGRITDAYTNIVTVKLFSQREREAGFARSAMQEFIVTVYRQMRLASAFEIVNHSLSMGLIACTAGATLWLWSQGQVSIGAVAAATAMALRLNGVSHWVMWEMSNLFEHIGTVQDGTASFLFFTPSLDALQTLAVPAVVLTLIGMVQIITILAILVSVSGLLVLVACLNLLMDERKREVALLRSFGSSKQKLKRMLSLEIGFMGFIAGIVACLFAEVISAVASYRMDLMLQPHWEIWLILPVFMTVLCALIGRYRLSYLCDIPPLQSLREMNQS